jgi:Icc-related predicted phosphoesterase
VHGEAARPVVWAVTFCLFCSDLHGRRDRYEKLYQAIESECPSGVFLGGDLLPGLLAAFGGDGDGDGDFVEDFLAAGFERLRERLGGDYPQVFLILGNDDFRAVEPALEDAEARGLWSYAHDRRLELGGFDVYGYSFVPPTPATSTRDASRPRRGGAPSPSTRSRRSCRRSRRTSIV